MLISTIHDVHDPQYPYPRYSQSRVSVHNFLIHDIHKCVTMIHNICIPNIHNPRCPWPTISLSTIFMIHDVIVHDPQCPLSSFELLFLIVIRISSLNSNAQISPKMPGMEEENGLLTAVGHWWALGRSLLLLAGRARKAEMVWKSLERGTGPVQPVLPRKPRPLRPLGLLPLPQGRWSS